MNERLPANYRGQSPEERDRWIASFVSETNARIEQLERKNYITYNYELASDAGATETKPLPEASRNKGKYARVINYSPTYTITLTGSINGFAEVDIERQYCGLELYCNGSTWVIVSTIGECEIQTIGSAIELVYTWCKDFTTDGSPPDSFAHGIPDFKKITFAYATALLSGSTLIYPYSLFSTSSETIYLSLDATNINIVYNSTYNSRRAYIELKYYI